MEDMDDDDDGTEPTDDGSDIDMDDEDMEGEWVRIVRGRADNRLMKTAKKETSTWMTTRATP